MAGMSRNNSTSSLSGFSVYQPALGAPLQFFPALGTQQLNDFLDLYLPGDASRAEKQATVSLDFFEYTARTGESYKFYQVCTPSFTSGSPASMQDSGYGSSYNPSPSLSNWSHGENGSFAIPSTPSTSFSPVAGPSRQATTSSAAPSRKLSTPTTRSTAIDFANLPGMKILTKDGRDVTNSASRGCKTKEQRDHAHLMRIMKACDSCRRKKIRCDPNHKKRVVGQAQAQTPAEVKPAKKALSARKPSNDPPPVSPMDTDFDFLSPLDSDSILPFLDETSAAAQEPWEQFVTYDAEPMDFIPYDFFFDTSSQQSPGTASASSSSVSPAAQQPYTPTPPAESPVDFLGLLNGQATSPSSRQKPILPYLNTGGSSLDYVDFNLYSPDSSFDEEPVTISKTPSSERLSGQSRGGHVSGGLNLMNDFAIQGSDLFGSSVDLVSSSSADFNPQEPPDKPLSPPPSDGRVASSRHGNASDSSPDGNSPTDHSLRQPWSVMSDDLSSCGRSRSQERPQTLDMSRSLWNTPQEHVEDAGVLASLASDNMSMDPISVAQRLRLVTTELVDVSHEEMRKKNLQSYERKSKETNDKHGQGVASQPYLQPSTSGVSQLEHAALPTTVPVPGPSRSRPNRCRHSSVVMELPLATPSSQSSVAAPADAQLRVSSGSIRHGDVPTSTVLPQGGTGSPGRSPRLQAANPVSSSSPRLSASPLPWSQLEGSISTNTVREVRPGQDGSFAAPSPIANSDNMNLALRQSQQHSGLSLEASPSLSSGSTTHDVAGSLALFAVCALLASVALVQLFNWASRRRSSTVMAYSTALLLSCLVVGNGIDGVGSEYVSDMLSSLWAMPNLVSSGSAVLLFLAACYHVWQKPESSSALSSSNELYETWELAATTTLSWLSTLSDTIDNVKSKIQKAQQAVQSVRQLSGKRMEDRRPEPKQTCPSLASPVQPSSSEDLYE